MATLTEINDVLTNNVANQGGQKLRERVGAACDIAAAMIVTAADTGDPWNQAAGEHEKRIKWVKVLMSNHDEMVTQIFHLVVGANSTFSQVQILAGDGQVLQDKVNVIINALASDVL